MDFDNEKRMMVAFALTLVALMVYSALFVKQKPHPPAANSPAQTATSAPQGTNAQPAKVPAPVALAVEQGAKAEDITVSQPHYQITFSTQGGLVKSWVLTQYRNERGRPLDLVDGAASKVLGYPLSIHLADAALSDQINHAVFAAHPDQTSLQNPNKLDLVYSDGKIRVTKEFTFSSGYETGVKVTVFDGVRDLPVEVSWLGGFGDSTLTGKARAAGINAAYSMSGKIETLALKKVGAGKLIPGPLDFAAIEDRFFAGVMIPDSPDDAFRIGQQSWTPPGGTDQKPEELLTGALVMPQPKPLSFRLAVAPKELAVLKSISPGLGLDGLVNFGIFSFIAKPLFLGLRYINDHWVHNYGWAIVILTVLLNTAFFPLKVKSMRSAQEMQKIAPLMKEIQDRYKHYKLNDPRKQRMNQEITKLYQEHHINPIGGCLPMLPQIPIMYGFYEVLETSIALRHAPWIGWIKDLSVPDHLYILPIFSIILSFLMTRMTPMGAVDPNQQKMMMIMPLAVGFIFFYEAAGLTLYYFVYSGIAVLQQLVINRMIPRVQPAVASPAVAGRARRPAEPKPLAVKE
ncbi:MAG TPA: membrane protein insertase YidC [Terriglobia bacterium]|nr:membrane protein insertase YidC [Terriglobia bacterium]HVB28507.1 membrane protein insertase YidC [Terriglobia bacterium]